MKKYRVNVNGSLYEIEVEEMDASAVSAAPAAPAAPKAPVAAAPAAGAQVKAPMPGNILDVKVQAGQTVKKGDVLVILEAMKMENEIFTAEGGVVKSIEAAQGASVNAGDVIITLG